MLGSAEVAEAAGELAAAAVFTVAALALDVEYQELAGKYKDDYREQREFYLDNFQERGEKPFTNEQFGIAYYVPDYYGMDRTGYFPPGVWFLFRPQLNNRINAMGNNKVPGYWKRFAKRYNPIQNAITLDTSSYALDVASINDDWNSYMNRYEEHKRDVFNERRWANRVGALSYGVKQAYNIERGLATSFEGFDKAQGELISELNSNANGLSTHANFRIMQDMVKKEFGEVY